MTVGRIFMMVATGMAFSSLPSSVIGADWPSGLYTLPMADTQTTCPTYKSGTQWALGNRKQDTESVIGLLGGNEWSSPNHLRGPLSKRDMTWNFCSKTSTQDDASLPNWAPGSYCIFKMGTKCPAGFTEGWVQWDDEDFNNANEVSGRVPEGVYDADTKIYFCCREDGSTIAPLNLPTTDPFILFMKEQAKCQNVNGMIDTQEWFKWDGEDELLGFERYFSGSVPFHDGRDNNHIIHFCYYEPINN